MNLEQEHAQKTGTQDRISSLEPNGYKFMVNVWVNAHGFIDTKMAFQQKLMENLKASGLKLPKL